MIWCIQFTHSRRAGYITDSLSDAEGDLTALIVVLRALGDNGDPCRQSAPD